MTGSHGLELQRSPAPAQQASSVPDETHRRRWRILALLSTVQFMLFVDDTMVNVALPTIQQDLGFSQTGLVWVVDAYVIVFGGCLLLGGRLTDYAGRRRMFAVGVTIFAAASLTNTLAQSPGQLVASRAVQGLGAALAAPASLSLAAVIFRDGVERTRAFALLSSLGGIGASAGVVLSGVITDLLDWRWIFYVNLPTAAVALALAFRMIKLRPRPRSGVLDVPGAITVTAAMALLVYTLLFASSRGWLSWETLAGLGGAGALLSVFVAIERRSPNPLVPWSFFHDQRRNAGIGLHYAIAAIVFGFFFLLTLYMQRVLGYSPLEGGLAWLGLFCGVFAGLASAQPLIARFGVRAILVAGLLLTGVGSLLFAQIPVDGDFVSDLLPGMVVAGLGLGWAYQAVTVAVVYDVEEHEAGLTAGMLNTGQQVGGALGLAVLVAIADDRARALASEGAHAAQVAGSHLAFVVAAVICAAAALVALALIGGLRPERMPQVPVPSPVD
jgi:EmrB/QacA subfamily drug resistance transporter